MVKYGNLSGRSGIVAFESKHGSIKIKFSDGNVYLYTDSSTGASNIVQMKKLARQGVGLNTFISQSVRENYEAKLS